jgi:hypothetical protein
MTKYKNGDLWIDRVTLNYWCFNGVRWILMGNLRGVGAA